MYKTLSFLRKHCMLLVLLVFSSLLVSAQRFPVKRELYAINDTFNRHANIILNNDGRIIVSSNGTTSSFWGLTFNNNYTIRSIDASGKNRWEKHHNKPNRLFINKMLPAPTKEGKFFTLGTYSIDPAAQYYASLKYRGWICLRDSSGNIVKEKYWGNSDYSSFFWSGTITADEKYLLAVGQRIQSHNAAANAMLVKLDLETLDTIWSRAIPPNIANSFFSIKELKTGDYVAVGRAALNGDTTFGQAAIVLMDSSGNIKWNRFVHKTGVAEALTSEQLEGNKSLAIGVEEMEDGIAVIGNSGWRALYDWSPKMHITDILVVKLSPTGNLIWHKNYGGADRDFVNNATLDETGNLLLAGYTSSPVGGDIPFRLPVDTESDIWILSIDKEGLLVNNLILGGSGEEGAFEVLQLPGGNLAVVGTSFSRDHYMLGNPRYRFSPLWVAELSRGSLFLHGKAFFDANEDGVKQDDEVVFDQLNVIIKNGVDTVGLLPVGSEGTWLAQLEPGGYNLLFESVNPNYTPANSSLVVTLDPGQISDTVHLPVRKIPGRNDLMINIVPTNPARPGFNAYYHLNVRNNGTVSRGDSVHLILDPRYTAIVESAGAQKRGDTLIWTIDALEPLTSIENLNIRLALSVPPFLNIEDTLQFEVKVFPISNDLTPHNNTFTLQQLVTGSYDPNDKTESHAGVLTQEQIDGGEYLNYLIRFQNTGTDTAFTVVIRDTLESRLDVSSLEMITASHDYTLSIQNSNQLSWTFNNILLADSNINEPASHGYVQFRIKPYPTLAPGDTIRNMASIYFDYNLPVLTNMEKTTLFIPGLLPVKLLKFTALRKNDRNELNWETAEETNSSHFIVERSFNGSQFSEIGRVNAKGMPASYTFSEVPPEVKIVYYRLKVIDIDGSFSYSPVMIVRLDANFSAILYPNPVGATASLEINSIGAETIQWSLRDMQGRLRQLRSLRVQKGKSTLQVSLDQLEPGMYVVSLSGAELEQNILIIKK